MNQEEFRLENGKLKYIRWDGHSDIWAVAGDLEQITFRTKVEAQDRARQLGDLSTHF